MISHLWSPSSDDIPGEIFIALTLAAAATLLVYRTQQQRSSPFGTGQ
jgi:hypothetical protein